MSRRGPTTCSGNTSFFARSPSIRLRDTLACRLLLLANARSRFSISMRTLTSARFGSTCTAGGTLLLNGAELKEPEGEIEEAAAGLAWAAASILLLACLRSWNFTSQPPGNLALEINDEAQGNRATINSPRVIVSIVKLGQIACPTISATAPAEINILKIFTIVSPRSYSTKYWRDVSCAIASGPSDYSVIRTYTSHRRWSSLLHAINCATDPRFGPYTRLLPASAAPCTAFCNE
jgi:hypothetical protein